MESLKAALRLMRVVILGFLPIVMGGCGVVMVRPPPTGHEQMAEFTCTVGSVGPILDVLASLGGLVTVAVAQGDYYYFVRPEMTAVGVTTAALYGISATVGFARTEKCRAATQRLEERLRQIQQSGVGTPQRDSVAFELRIGF